MTKKGVTTMKKTINHIIKQALGSSADYKELSLKKARKIAKIIEDQYNFSTKIELAGNYTYSNKIVFYFHDKINRKKDDNPNIEFEILISERGAIATFICRLKNESATRGTLWEFAEMENWPKFLVVLKDEFSKILSREKLHVVNDDELLQAEAQGHLTELDGVQANMFEVLFGEVI